MIIAIAADHGGFPLNDKIMEALRRDGHQIVDLGTHDGSQPDDYPDYALRLGATITSGEAERGIFLCGSGVGASIAINKIKGIRAGLCHDTYSAHQGVEHDHMNVLCLGARIVGEALALELVQAFLKAVPSAEERHLRRVGKIATMEK